MSLGSTICISTMDAFTQSSQTILPYDTFTHIHAHRPSNSLPQTLLENYTHTSLKISLIQNKHRHAAAKFYYFTSSLNFSVSYLAMHPKTPNCSIHELLISKQTPLLSSSCLINASKGITNVILMSSRTSQKLQKTTQLNVGPSVLFTLTLLSTSTSL